MMSKKQTCKKISYKGIFSRMKLLNEPFILSRILRNCASKDSATAQPFKFKNARIALAHLSTVTMQIFLNFSFMVIANSYNDNLAIVILSRICTYAIKK